MLPPPKQDFQYQLQLNVPPISQTTPSLTVTTLQPVPQGLQNSKQELEHYELQWNAPHVSQTKPTSTVTTVQEVPQELQNAKQDLQQAPSSNKHPTNFSQEPPQSIHLVDEQMKKMEITTNTKISTLVQSSSDVNILSSPITTVHSRLPGPVLEDHLKSLERNMMQLFNILTTTVNNKNQLDETLK